MIHFSFADYWIFYSVFSCFILLLLFLDLGVFHRQAHEVSLKEATIWTVVWVLLALLFNILFYIYCFYKFNKPEYASLIPDGAAQAKTLSLEFFAGYIVEKTLSVDNTFVFTVVFSYFKIPKQYQHRVLFWGVIGALVFRAIFISISAILIQYQTVVMLFGIILMATGIKILIFKTDEQADLNKNLIIRLLKRIFTISDKIDGQHFFVKANHKWCATPLFIALAFIEFTDIIFAIDSVPAIYALTNEPFIVYTSNIFAMMGLRSMYFMLSGVIDRFIYIKYGLGAILVFVGLKMVYLNDAFGGKFPITWSLLIIITLLGASILASLIKGNNQNRIH